MPGNSWQNLRRNSSTLKPADNNVSAANNQALRPTAGVNPQLDELLRERQELESNLESLISGTASDSRQAALFQVPTFAQRQAQQREWEQQRERLRQEQNQSSHPDFERFGRVTDAPGQLRTGLRNFQQPVSEWLDQRDQQRQSLRSRFDRADRQLKNATRPIRNLGEQVGSASRQLRELDQKLAAEGLDSDREELRKLGSDKLYKADKTLQKINGAIDAPGRAVKKIDDFWQRRDKEISGAMDRFGPYADNARRRLSLERGGSGDLFERMRRNRERALERRREYMMEHARDQARRDRALQRKKEKDRQDT